MNETPPGIYPVTEYTTSLRGRPIRVFSQAHLQDSDQPTIAASLLADVASLNTADRVLQLGSGSGALTVALGRQLHKGPPGHLWVMDYLSIALDLTKKTVAANGISNAHLSFNASVLPEKAEFFNVAVMELPKSRVLARRWLVESYGALQPGGTLYLAGAKPAGIQPVIRDAQALFGKLVILGYKKGNRVARAIKDRPSIETGVSDFPEWVSEPGIAPGSWYQFNADLGKIQMQIRSLPGVFSYNRIDEGTRLLLSAMQVPEGGYVLDWGCGYGVIGLVAGLQGAGQVDLCDLNLLAVASARENARLNGVDTASIYSGDLLEAGFPKQYHLIVSNPPFHTGKDVDYRAALALIFHARQALLPGGRLLIVANKFIRYDRQMHRLFYRVERLAETGKFHVWQGYTDQ